MKHLKLSVLLSKTTCHGNTFASPEYADLKTAVTEIILGHNQNPEFQEFINSDVGTAFCGTIAKRICIGYHNLWRGEIFTGDDAFKCDSAMEASTVLAYFLTKTRLKGFIKENFSTKIRFEQSFEIIKIYFVDEDPAETLLKIPVDVENVSEVLTKRIEFLQSLLDDDFPDRNCFNNKEELRILYTLYEYVDHKKRQSVIKKLKQKLAALNV